MLKQHLAQEGRFLSATSLLTKKECYGKKLIKERTVLRSFLQNFEIVHIYIHFRRSVQRLNLCHNGIGETGAAALAAVLCENAHLVELYITQNCTDETIYSLVVGLRQILNHFSSMFHDMH